MPELRKNTERHRYEAVQHHQVLGYAVYRDVGGAVELPHTVVEPAYGGQGVASAIVRFALDDIQASGQRVIPACEFVAAYIQRHPQYASLVA